MCVCVCDNGNSCLVPWLISDSIIIIIIIIIPHFSVPGAVSASVNLPFICHIKGDCKVLWFISCRNLFMITLS